MRHIDNNVELSLWYAALVVMVLTNSHPPYATIKIVTSSVAKRRCHGRRWMIRTEEDELLNHPVEGQQSHGLATYQE
eukprot:scaffold7934_cov59-Attheya_sp.AAC.9